MHSILYTIDYVDMTSLHSEDPNLDLEVTLFCLMANIPVISESVHMKKILKGDLWN